MYGGAGYEACAQGVAGDLVGVQADGFGIVFQQAGNVRRMQGAAAQIAVAPHRLKHESPRDTRGPEPVFQAFYWFNPLAVRHADALAFPGLVGFRLADMHKHPAVIVSAAWCNDFDIACRQRTYFGAAQGSGESKRNDRRVAQTDEAVGALLQHAQDMVLPQCLHLPRRSGCAVAPVLSGRHSPSGDWWVKICVLPRTACLWRFYRDGGYRPITFSPLALLAPEPMSTKKSAT